jgi:hypothetical protein
MRVAKYREQGTPSPSRRERAEGEGGAGQSRLQVSSPAGERGEEIAESLGRVEGFSGFKFEVVQREGISDA